jgi:hypothetical protein
LEISVSKTWRAVGKDRKPISDLKQLINPVIIVGDREVTLLDRSLTSLRGGGCANSIENAAENKDVQNGISEAATEALFLRELYYLEKIKPIPEY